MKAKKAAPFDFSEVSPESTRNPTIDEKEALPDVSEGSPKESEKSHITSEAEDT